MYKFDNFDLQLCAATLPDAPTTSMATVGKDYLVFVCTGSSWETPTWTLIGGQRGASLSRKADEIDISNKADSGWKATLAGLKSWSIDLDGLMLLNDEGVDALETAFVQGKKVFLKFQYPDKRYRTGWAAITDLSCETPHDGEASLKGTMSGVGPLSDLMGCSVSPISATVSKAAATDKVFTFTPNTATVSSIKLAGVTVTASNYTSVAGSLTIKGTYLGTLDVADQIFTLTFADSSTLTLTITVTA